MDLTYMYLSENQLSGSIPPELGNLASLTSIYLGSNQLSGGIPLELGDLINLTKLVLADNQLSGSIPPELGNLIKLTDMLLSYNQFSGSIPPELSNLTGLKFLWLQDNQLSGDIPPAFVNLVNLYNPGQFYGQDGLDLDYNILNVPPGYPDPNVPLQVFLHQKDPDWQLYQGFTQMIGAGGGELTSLDRKTDFLFPAGALITDTTFTFIPQPVPHHNSGKLAFAYNSFELSAEDADGNPVTIFNIPITVTLTYTDTDVIAPESTLGLYFWNESASAWMDAVITCPGGAYTRNPDANTFSLPLCHLTEFSVFGTPLRVYIPVIRR